MPDIDGSSGSRPRARGSLVFALLALWLAAAPAMAQNRPPDALTTAQGMKRAGATATAVAGRIRVDFRTTALGARDVLKTAGYDAVQITGALKDEFRMAALELFDALESAGYPSRTIHDALDRNGLRVDLDCIDAQGYPAPCGNFGGNAAQPAMGQLTWTPAGQGTVNGTLTITGSNIPQVEVRIGNAILSVTSASATTVVAALPSSPAAGALTLRRVSDGVIGELDPAYDVVEAPQQQPQPEPGLNWAGFAVAARDAAVEDARTWLSGAGIVASQCKVIGILAVGSAGVFASTQQFQQRIRAALLAHGAPADLAAAWDQAFRDAWQEWSSQVTVPGLPLFPAFGAWPAAIAPPTPAAPAPLVTMVSSGTAAMAPPMLADRVTNAIGPAASEPDAVTAIATFAAGVGSRFTKFMFEAQVMGVNGSGPVPSYDPPTVIVGPVTGGTCGGANVLPSWHTF